MEILYATAVLKKGNKDTISVGQTVGGDAADVRGLGVADKVLGAVWMIRRMDTNQYVQYAPCEKDTDYILDMLVPRPDSFITDDGKMPIIDERRTGS